MFVVITKNPKISKNKPHPYSEQFFLEKRNSRTRFYTLDRSRDCYLMKYCPRYYKDLQLRLKTSSKTISALKRIKKVTKVQDCFPERANFPVNNQWRLILQNKFKSVESYKDSFDLRSSVQKRKVFSRLTTLSLCNGVNPEELKTQKLYTYFWHWQMRHLGGFVNLKFLDVTIHYEEDFIVLKKLDPLTRLLSSLKTLSISFERVEDASEKIGFLPTIIKYKNLLRYITHLMIGDIKQEEDCEVFKQLAQYCKNLGFISFDICKEVSVNFLQMLGNFEKLEGINIYIDDLPSFIENFIAPSSLKFATFCFNRAAWKDLCQRRFSTDIASFLKNPKSPEILLKIERFSQQWKNLVSLKIETNDVQGETDFILLFIAIAFLQNIQFLENLKLMIYGLPKPTQATTFSLASLFNLAPNICSQLKSFTLFVPRTYSLNFEPESKSQNIALPQLKSFELIAHLSSAQETMKRIFATFPDHDISISLNLAIVSNQDLIELLQDARDLSKKRNIKIKIIIYELDFKSFDKQFQEFLKKKENTSVVSNVTLEVKTSLVFPKASWSLLGELSESFASVSLVKTSLFK